MTTTRKHRDDTDDPPQTPLAICWCPWCRVYGPCPCDDPTPTSEVPSP